MALYALLVGIDNYRSKSIPTLSGAEKDMARINKYLTTTFPGPDTHILALTSGQATKKAVVDAFTSHLGQAKTGDQALFYFSGHGALEGTHPAFSTTETARCIESMVCHDSIGDSTTLSDKELRYLIHRLSQKGPEIIILQDCCHAGGATRNADMILKRLTQEVPARSWNDFIFSGELTESAAKAAASLNDILPQGEHVQLAACESEQSAWEVRGSGIFTANLLQVLQDSQGSISYRDLFSRLKYQVAYRFAQIPSMYIRSSDSHYDGRLFMGGNRKAPAGGNANIVYSPALNTWILDKGAIQGVRTITGEFDLELRTDAGSAPVTTAKIVSILPDQSRLELKDPGIPQRSYLTTVKGLYQRPFAILPTGEEAGVDALKEFYETNKDLYGSEGIRLTDTYANADYVAVAHDNAYYLIRPDEPNEPGKLEPVVEAPQSYSEASARQLLNYGINIARWEFMKGLSNPDTTIDPFPFELVFTTADANGKAADISPDKNGLLQLAYDATSAQGMQGAAKVGRLKLVSRTAKPYYGACVYLGLAFNIETDMVTEEVAKPDDDHNIWIYDGENAKFTQETYTKDFNRPAETAYLLLIASTDKFSISDIKQDALPLPKKDQDRGPGQARGMQRDRQGDLPPSDWTTRLITLQFTNPYYVPPPKTTQDATSSK